MNAVLPGVLDREPLCASSACEPMLGDAREKRAAVEIVAGASEARFMDEVVEAVHRAAATPLYRDTVLSRSPALAREAPQRLRSLLSGFDFHLTPQGPRLIEINTNAGGFFYGAAIGELLRLEGAGGPPLEHWSKLFVRHVRSEWEAAAPGRVLRTVAIVDDAPESQFLRFEFHLAARFLQEAGLVAFVADVRELEFDGARLLRGGIPVDFVYNRLTSFALDRPEDRPLHDALRKAAAVVSPDPRTHALLACKANLALLGDEAFLRDAGLDPASREVLLKAVPRARVLDDANADALWRARASHYFKPLSGFGSRAVYDGAKLTARTWSEIRRTGFLAQERVEPPRIEVAGEVMRYDVRTFAFGAETFMRLARVYRGQTTNFRTKGGGFAPVRIAA